MHRRNIITTARSRTRFQRTFGVLTCTIAVLCIEGCGLFELGHPSLMSRDPSLRIPAIKKAAAEHQTAAIPILVKGLNSTDPAIRFYCAYALKQITGRQMGYVYYAPASQRQLAILRWRQWESQHVTTKPNGVHG